MSLGPTIAHFRGQKPVDLLAPTLDDIDFECIADRLSKIPRFLAGTSQPYWVAQHSVWVMDRVGRAAQPYALLHDAPEAFVGDRIRPVLSTMDIMIAGLVPEWSECRLFSDGFEILHRAFAQRIHEAAGINRSLSPVIAQEIKDADNYACDVEYRSLILDERVPGAPVPVSSERAKADFLAALRAVCPNARVLS